MCTVKGQSTTEGAENESDPRADTKVGEELLFVKHALKDADKPLLGGEREKTTVRLSTG